MSSKPGRIIINDMSEKRKNSKFYFNKLSFFFFNISILIFLQREATNFIQSQEEKSLGETKSMIPIVSLINLYIFFIYSIYYLSIFSIKQFIKDYGDWRSREYVQYDQRKNGAPDWKEKGISENTFVSNDERQRQWTTKMNKIKLFLIYLIEFKYF